MRWTVDWNTHLRDVKTFFVDKPSQLLVFDIERDDANKIVEFLKTDFALDVSQYATSNETLNRHRRFATVPSYFIIPPVKSP